MLRVCLCSTNRLCLRLGAANLDVIQEVEYVKQENKLPYLLHCLQKTEPPALVFCENKKDVDDIQEYLLLKGVEAGAIHGGLAQEERSEAVRLFKCANLVECVSDMLTESNGGNIEVVVFRVHFFVNLWYDEISHSGRDERTCSSEQM